MITGDMFIAKTLRRYSGDIEVSRKRNMEVQSRVAAVSERVGGGALMYGINLDEMLKEHNRAIGEKAS